MIFVGIDPGTNILGFSVIKDDEKSDNNLSLLSSGILQFDKKDALPKKLFFTYDFFLSYIEKYKLEHGNCTIAVEKQYIGKNPHSAFCLISSRTIFMLLSEKLNCKYIEFEPSVIKKMVSGNGQATKDMMISSIKFYFNNLDLISSDETDAIACSLSAALNFKFENL